MVLRSRTRGLRKPLGGLAQEIIMDNYNIRQVIARFKIDMAKHPCQLALAEAAEKELQQFEAAQQDMQADLPKRCPVCGTTKHHIGANGFVVQNTANR